MSQSFEKKHDFWYALHVKTGGYSKSHQIHNAQPWTLQVVSHQPNLPNSTKPSFQCLPIRSVRSARREMALITQNHRRSWKNRQKSYGKMQVKTKGRTLEPHKKRDSLESAHEIHPMWWELLWWSRHPFPPLPKWSRSVHDAPWQVRCILPFHGPWPMIDKHFAKKNKDNKMGHDFHRLF